jgi:hypothetical protein
MFLISTHKIVCLEGSVLYVFMHDSMHLIRRHVLGLKFQISKFLKNIFTMDLESCTKMLGVQ